MLIVPYITHVKNYSLRPISHLKNKKYFCRLGVVQVICTFYFLERYGFSYSPAALGILTMVWHPV